MTRVLVTGGAGFIGANLCRELLRRGEVSKITVFDDFSTGKVSNLDGLPVDVEKDTVLNRKAVSMAVREHDVVIHLAARPSVPLSVEDPWRSHDVNVNGTMHLLEACRDHHRPMIFASSSAVYGPTTIFPTDEDQAPAPQSPYAANKLAAEAYALSYAASYRLPVMVYRFFNVYGPLQSPDHAYAAVIPSFIDAALNRKPLVIYGDGLQTRDFTFVGSVAQVLANTATERLSSNRPVNLAFGTRTTVLELASLIESIVGFKQVKTFRPSRPGDVKDSQAAVSSLRRLMPRQRDYSLRDGLQATVEWFRDSAREPRPDQFQRVSV